MGQQQEGRKRSTAAETSVLLRGKCGAGGVHQTATVLPFPSLRGAGSFGGQVCGCGAGFQLRALGCRFWVHLGGCKSRRMLLNSSGQVMVGSTERVSSVWTPTFQNLFYPGPPPL